MRSRAARAAIAPDQGCFWPFSVRSRGVMAASAERADGVENLRYPCDAGRADAEEKG